MKFCQDCGNQLEDNAVFCQACGNRSVSSTPVNNPAPTVVYAQPMIAMPVGQLKTNRGLLRVILFSIITFGIYPLVFYSSISNDVNVVCSRYDGKRTMHYCLLYFLVGPWTLGIAYFVWHHKMCNRIGCELRRRGVNCFFGASDFWLWNILGSFIVVGPFIYIHKLAKAMNALCGHYNMCG